MSIYKYSFIIPHKNSPDLLKRCLSTIPKRSDIQIIVVDDNSDESCVNFKEFPGAGEKCVEVYFTKEGHGAGYARNIGLEYAKGDWLLFADADDYYSENFIDILDKHLIEDIDLLFFNVYSDGNSKSDRAFWINKQYVKYLKNDYLDDIKYQIWAPWNKVFSHKLIRNNSIKFDEVPVGNDAIFSLTSSFCSKKSKLIQDKLYCITYTPNSITFSKFSFEKKLNYARINIRINKFFDKHNLQKYRVEVFTFSTLIGLITENGIRHTVRYLNYVSENYSIRLSMLHTMNKILSRIID